MTLQDRIALIRLYNLLEENKEYADKLGISVEFKMKKRGKSEKGGKRK